MPTAAVQNFLVTHDGVPQRHRLQHDQGAVDEPRPAGRRALGRKAIELKNALEGMPVPLHPGAEKYYKEVGLLK